jgi:prefoldin subunit 5
MSGIDEISKAIGSLEAQVTNLTTAVTTLNTTVQSLQKARWTTKGLLAGLTLVGGAAGSKIAALFGGPPPTGH